MSTQRRKVSRSLQFDALEGKALLSAVMVGPQPVAVPAAIDNGYVQAPISVNTDKFRHTGGETEYDLTFTSGRYKFIQNYEMEIDRIKGRPDNGIAAVDAMGIFLDRAYSLLYSNRPIPVSAGSLSAATVENGDYAITSERLKQRGGYIKFEMTIESGAYKFQQEYTFKLKRVNRGPNTGLTALEAVDVFTSRLVWNVERVLLHRPVPIQPMV